MISASVLTPAVPPLAVPEPAVISARGEVARHAPSAQAARAAAPAGGMRCVSGTGIPGTATLRDAAALEGERSLAIVADARDGTPVGSLLLAVRALYLDGHATTGGVLLDLQVDPERGGGDVAAGLLRFARDFVRRSLGEAVPVLVTVPATAAAGLGWIGPDFAPAARIRLHTLDVAAVAELTGDAGSGLRGDLDMRPGSASDLPEMADLWRRLAPRRQLAPVLGPPRLARWVARALDPACFLLARDEADRLAGFLGITEGGGPVRMGGARAPAPRSSGGGPASPPKRPWRPAVARYRSATAVIPCAPAGAPDLLQALLVRSCRTLLGSGYRFLHVGVDVHDPLLDAFRGLPAQTRDVHACLPASSRLLAGHRAPRPFHFEVALT